MGEKTKGAQSTKQTEPGVNNLSNFYFPLPLLTEQQTIAGKVKTLLAKCGQLQDEAENQIQHSKDLLKLLFNETFKV